MKKRILALLLLLALTTALLPGCRKKVTTGEIGVEHDTEFGGTYIGLTIDQFNKLGFAFGDSVDIAFRGGKTLEDVPYYSGYYVPVGSLLLCGYPGYPHPVIARNFGNSSWEEFGMTEDSKVTVTLREKGKYLSSQEFYSLKYSDERKDFDSDVIFANFRELRGGNLRAGAVYRSASPIDNQHKRASYANALAEKYGIAFALNLSDTQEKYQKHVAGEDFSSQYYDGLYKDGKVMILEERVAVSELLSAVRDDLYETGKASILGMTANYRSTAFARTLAEGLAGMSENEGPCLIHCVEGKDRTGFVCALLLALADASPQEILDEYMITFDNYYKITKETKPEQYAAVEDNAKDFFYCMCDVESGTPLDQMDVKKGAEDYLRRGGLTDEEIAKIEAWLR